MNGEKKKSVGPALRGVTFGYACKCRNQEWVRRQYSCWFDAAAAPESAKKKMLKMTKRSRYVIENKQKWAKNEPNFWPNEPIFLPNEPQTNPFFGQTNSFFCQTNSIFGQTKPAFSHTKPVLSPTKRGLNRGRSVPSSPGPFSRRTNPTRSRFSGQAKQTPQSFACRKHDAPCSRRRGAHHLLKLCL